MDAGEVVDGRYRVRRRLGEGAFGEVLEAEDQNLGRAIALKLLKVSVADEELQARFDREARVTASLTHPHVVTLYGHGVTADGRPYLAYELLEGEDLEARQQRGGVSEDDVFRWGVEVAEALHFAHERGVVHRDVKPANVFLKQGDVAVLCDFGIARSSSGATALTSEGVLLGTPAYMSPEMWRGHTPSPASDQWAWAASLFELLYGQAPYPGDGPREIMEQALDGHEVRVPAGFQGRRPALQEVLLRALAVDPDRRFRDLERFAEALREAARGSLQDVLERSGVGLDPKAMQAIREGSRQTRVLPPEVASTRVMEALEETPTRVAGGPGRIPRWVLVVGASAFMAVGVLWPSRVPVDEPLATPSPTSPQAAAVPPAPAVPPEVLERLAPLRSDLLAASREVRRMAGGHPADPLPDRLLRFTYHHTERRKDLDPEGAGGGILEYEDRQVLWSAYLDAAASWLEALAREQDEQTSDLLADAQLLATLDALIYRPQLRILEVASMDYWWWLQNPDFVGTLAQTNFLALGRIWESYAARVQEAWGRGGGVPAAIANALDVGKVLGRSVWTEGASWDAYDQEQLAVTLRKRVAAAPPGPIGAVAMRLACYHLCLTSLDQVLPWGERDELLQAVADRLLEDPGWQAHPGRLLLLLRVLIEEMRQRRVKDAPPAEEDHPGSRTARVYAAVEQAMLDDPGAVALGTDVAWRVCEWAGSVGFYNKDGNSLVRPWSKGLAKLRGKAREAR